MRNFILVTAAALTGTLPGTSANAVPLAAPMSAATQALSDSETVQYRNSWRDYADEAPWVHGRRPLGAVPPPVGGGGGDSFSNGTGIGGGDTASNGTAAFWGTNSRAFGGN